MKDLIERNNNPIHSEPSDILSNPTRSNYM